MKLGVIKAVSTSGERVVLDVQIDESRYREVALLHPLGVRIRVAAGDRVLVGQIDANTDALFAWPVTISREVDPALQLVGDAIEIVGDEIAILGDQVLAKSANGIALPLPTKADIDALTAAVNAMVVVFNTAQAAANAAVGLWLTSVPMVPAPAAVCTQSFKGE
jgi:hypothetical protein